VIPASQELAPRVYTVLKRDPAIALSAEDIGIKFGLDRGQVGPQLEQYVARGYLDRLGKGRNLKYKLGPIEPDAPRPTILRSAKLPAIDLSTVVLREGGLPPRLTTSDRGNPYDPLFAMLRAPNTWLEGVDPRYHATLKAQCKRRNAAGGLARFCVRRLVSGGIALCRDEDAEAPAEPGARLQRVA